MSRPERTRPVETALTAQPGVLPPSRRKSPAIGALRTASPDFVAVASVSSESALLHRVPGPPDPLPLPAAATVLSYGGGEAARRALVDGLRARIGAIERPALRPPALRPHALPSLSRGGVESAPLSASAFHSPSPLQVSAPRPWGLGIDGIDGPWLAGGLATGLHEVRPAAYGDWPAALGFALALAVRSEVASRAAGRQSAAAGAPILLCWTEAWARDMGSPHGAGLAALGLDPARLLLVEAARQDDVLWTLEESLKSEGIALAIGITNELALTPSRRLTLASEAGATSCLVLGPPGSAVTASLTRWRIARAPSPILAGDPRAPGPPAFEIALERSRQSRRDVSASVAVVEWCDATRCFRLAAPLADRAHGPPRARAGAA